MNKQLWNLYKKSEEGQKVISLFEFSEDKLIDVSFCDIYKFGLKWGCSEEGLQIFSNVFILEEDLIRQNLLFEIKSRNDFERLIDSFELVKPIFEKEEIKFDTDSVRLKKDDFRSKSAMIQDLSWVLFLEYGYFPILYPSHFEILQKSFDLLGIEIPEIPHTNQYKEYCLYYYDINEVLLDFKERNELSIAELCACIYDFSLLLDDKEDSVPLPEPTNVWLTGGSGKDFVYLDSLGKNKDFNKNDIWACNERTKRGDIIIMYCTSPRSYIHSIWRAKSNGIFNLFDYYKCRTQVCNGIEVPKVTFKELTEDEYFSKIPIVKKRLQGINGVEFTAEQYEKLLEMFSKKGFNIDVLPKLFSCDSVSFGEIKIEKDVEEKLLIPILQKLGYEESNWIRQLSLKAGRKEKAIPDFVFFPKGIEHFETAPFVIESKYDFSSMIEFQKAFSQCFSYAKMLQSKIIGICDKERLVIYKMNSNGIFDRTKPIFENHWKTIYSNSIVGAELKQIIGAEVIKVLK